MAQGQEDIFRCRNITTTQKRWVACQKSSTKVEKNHINMIQKLIEVQCSCFWPQTGIKVLGGNLGSLEKALL